MRTAYTCFCTDVIHEGHLKVLKEAKKHGRVIIGALSDEELIRYISCQEKRRLKKIFLVHGEAETQEHFKETLNKRGYKRVEVADFREEVEI